MAEIAANPYIMRNAIITFGTPGDDYAAAVSSAVLTPSSGTAEFKGLKKEAVFTFPQATTWTLDLTFSQDWSSNTSLGAYLFANAGTVVPFTFDSDDLGNGHTTWAGEVALVAGAVGGEVDAVADATVSLGVIGQPTPTLVPATP